MAIDYGMQVPQVQPMQPQNMLQQVMLFNQMNEARRETQEKNALRELLSTPGLDTSDPDTFRKIVGVAPKAGPAVVASLARANADARAGRASTLSGELSGEQRRVAAAERFRNELPGVLASANPADAYKSWRTRFAETMGTTNLPEEFPGVEAVRGIMSTATQAIEAARAQYSDVGGVPVRRGPNDTLIEQTFIPAQPGGPTPRPGGPQADVTGAPSYRSPTSVAAMERGRAAVPGAYMTDEDPTAAPLPLPRPAEMGNAMSPFGANAQANMMASSPGGRPASEVIALKARADELRKIEQVRLETEARKIGETNVKTKELEPQIDAAIRELTAAAASGGLISKSTGSGLGRQVDAVAGYFGKATSGAVAGGQLKPIADLVLKIVPRFEGPQSDKDTQSYREAAGSLADTSVPVEIRQAAAKEIVRLLKTRRGQFTMDGATSEPGKITDRAPAVGAVDQGYRFKGGDPADKANWEKQ